VKPVGLGGEAGWVGRLTQLGWNVNPVGLEREPGWVGT